MRHIIAMTLLFTVAAAVACGARDDQTRGSANESATTSANAQSGATPRFKVMAVGDAAPLYVIPTLGGDTVHIGQSGEPLTVMNVWATWCVSCREEMQDLQTLHDDYKPKGVRVLGVSVDETDVTRVRKFVEREKLTFPMAHDQDGRVQTLYQINGIPNTFIIASDGRILWKSIGNLHGVVDSLRRVLDGALAGSAGTSQP